MLLHNLEVGMTVIVRGGFGGEPPEKVVIEDYEVEGKNGRDTICYTDKRGEGRWAYISQVDRVVSA